MRSKCRSSVSGIAIAFGLLTAAGCSSAGAQTFDRFVIVQPIRVCDDAGNNCAVVNFFHAGTARALGQAGVLPIFLPQVQYDDTVRLNANSGPGGDPDGFNETHNGSTDAQTINMWFTAPGSIYDCGGVAAIGCASTPGRAVVIDSQALLNEAAGNGGDPYHRTIAHEMGHAFSLPHVSGAGLAGNLMEVPATVDRSGTYDEIGVDRFLLNAGQITAIRADGKLQIALDCNGDGGPNAITLAAGDACQNIFAQGGADVVTLNAGSGVLTDVQGNAGDDIIDIQSGSIVGRDVTGDADNDSITIGGIVLNNVLGGSGNDSIFILSTAEVIRSVDAGSGNDFITMTGGSVGGNLEGGAGIDGIAIIAGAVGGSILGGGDGDSLIVGGGTVAQNVDGGNGGDGIGISGGTVGGSVLGGAGGDNIQISDTAVIAGNVDGQGDDDTISILGVSSITGSVLGGGGVDNIFIFGGTVGGNIEGQAGNDDVTIAGGTVSGSILTQDGTDRVDLNGGSVVGNVETGADADTIEQTATAVGGSIVSGAGNDTVRILGGSTGSVFTNEDNDSVLWRAGTIANLVVTGLGTDTLDIVGSAAGGSAVQTGLTVLDGGDDASSADGQIDTLNLLGVQQELTNMQNWEFINLLGNSRGDLGDVSRIITTEQLSIDATSTLIVTSDAGATSETYTIQGNVLNAGAIDMLDAAPNYDEFRVTGTYNGVIGSLFGIDAFLGAAGSPADLMRVGTATLGRTGISVFDANAAGPGVFNPVGIDVVRVEGAPGSTAKDNFFLLGGPIQKDLWVWDLTLDDTRSNPLRLNADVHVLYTRPSDVVQFSPYFSTGALTAFHSSLEPWVDRQQQLADTLASRNLVTTSFKDEPAAQAATYFDVWAATFGSQRSESSVSKLTFFGDSFSAVMDYDQSTFGFQGGIDMISILENGGAVMAGVFGGYLDSSVDPDQVPVSGDFSGGSVGVYMAYVQSGFTLSAVGKGDFLSFDWRAPVLDLEASADVQTFGGRIEAAYKRGLTSAAWVEPYANITYASSNWDRFTVLATTFDLDGNESLLGRLGFRLGADFRYTDTLFTKVFAGIGVVHEFDERNVARIVSGGFTLPLTHEVDTTSLEVQGGVKLEDVGNGLSLSVTSSGRFSDDVEEYGGRAVINYKF